MCTCVVPLATYLLPVKLDIREYRRETSVEHCNQLFCTGNLVVAIFQICGQLTVDDFYSQP